MRIDTVDELDRSLYSSIQEQRHAIRSLLASHDPADARTAYYALQHDPHRTTLTLNRAKSGGVDGFLATCITGANPFQPLVVLRAFGPGTLEALIRGALIPGRSYLFSVPVYVGAALEEVVSNKGHELMVSDITIWHILRTDSSRFVPLINVLVTREWGAGEQPRWQIRVPERVIAAAGINWRSSHWAEVYVTAESTARTRRWDESVLAAATSTLLAEGVTPLYLIAEDDIRSHQAAQLRGYYDSGAREFTCVVTVLQIRDDGQV